MEDLSSPVVVEKPISSSLSNSKKRHRQSYSIQFKNEVYNSVVNDKLSYGKAQKKFSISTRSTIQNFVRNGPYDNIIITNRLRTIPHVLDTLENNTMNLILNLRMNKLPVTKFVSCL